MRNLLIAFMPCLLAAQVPQDGARVQSFQASAKAVRKGGTVTLRWSAAGADTVRLEPVGLVLPARGEITHRIEDRTIYWLHVTNATGGHSVPLVVDLIPEPLPPAPAPMPLPQPALQPELPRLATLPAVPPSPALPVNRPEPRPVQVAHVTVRTQAARKTWIQFASVVGTRKAARLRSSLLRLASAETSVVVRRGKGRTYQVVRSLAFPTAQEARTRLAELEPALRALRIRPMLVYGPAQPVTPAVLYAGAERAR
ncbi:MAG TPA: hypothetical protein VK188_15770 [Holophaga sp.]|nr:hypothetical protein [Holophaga sp.]